MAQKDETGRYLLILILEISTWKIYGMKIGKIASGWSELMRRE